MQQRERLYAQIWTLVGDMQLAEDVLQEVSLLAVDKATEVPDDDRLIAWLRRAARLKSLEALRSLGRQVPPFSDELLDQFDVEWQSRDACPDSEIVAALRECMQQLTPDNRRLLKLRYASGKKTGDIADLLGRKAATVYQALSRVHRVLRQCIQGKLKGSVHE